MEQDWYMDFVRQWILIQFQLVCSCLKSFQSRWCRDSVCCQTLHRWSMWMNSAQPPLCHPIEIAPEKETHRWRLAHHLYCGVPLLLSSIFYRPCWNCFYPVAMSLCLPCTVMKPLVYLWLWPSILSASLNKWIACSGISTAQLQWSRIVPAEDLAFLSRSFPRWGNSRIHWYIFCLTLCDEVKLSYHLLGVHNLPGDPCVHAMGIL